MHIVAIYNLPEKKELLAATLALALKATVYEALSRLKSLGHGPLVVGVSATLGQAEELWTRLKTSGFDAVLLKDEEIETDENRLVVQKFRIGGDALIAESGTSERVAVNYGSIDLIIRGTSIAQTTLTENEKERKFAPGMALLTGGLKMTKTTEYSVENTTQQREGFFLLYSGDQKTLVFRESRLVYSSLGAALQTTRRANFSLLLQELRRRSPDACYDDRLLTRAVQVQLLGPSLNPEQYLDIATSLLGKLLT